MLLSKNGSTILERKRSEIMKMKYSIKADEILNDLCLQFGFRNDFLKGVNYSYSLFLYHAYFYRSKGSYMNGILYKK